MNYQISREYFEMLQEHSEPSTPIEEAEEGKRPRDSWVWLHATKAHMLFLLSEFSRGVYFFDGK
jgi:hypothetical protein